MGHYRLIAGLLLAAATVGVAGAVTSVSGADQDRRLVESVGCHRSRPKAPTLRPNTQTISVTIPATVFLRVDRSGRVTAAATNTGCAPRDGDDVYLFRPDGSITLTSEVELDDFNWTGDFTSAGIFQPQRFSSRSSVHL